MNRKCAVCLAGTWIIGLAALAWGPYLWMGYQGEPSFGMRVTGLLVAFTAVGFLAYQRPFKPCPRCVSAQKGA